MASLSNVLASIPGMAGYYAKDQLNREQTAGELQQVGALSNLAAQMQARERQAAARQALAGLGPDATEDQQVRALIPHIGDPDKLAGILQNASLKKAQQDQTKQIAMTRLQQQASQHLDNLGVKLRNAQTAEERSHWEQQIAQAQLGFRQQEADIKAGRYNYETGMTVPPLPRPFVAPQAAPSGTPAAPAVPIPAPAPSPVPVAPGQAPMGRQTPTEGLTGKLRILDSEIAQLDQMISNATDPRERAQFEADKAAVQKERAAAVAAGGQIPAAPNNLDARDLRIAAVSAPTAAPQAAPQPAAEKPPIVMPPEIARLPKKAQDAWMADQIKRADEKGRKGELPTAALRMQQEEVDAISTASTINADLGAVSNQLATGKLKLSLIDNVAGELRNKVGISNEDSQNLASFKATLEKLRNDSLRLNKGVQTEGDAVRAWNELVANINDAGVVRKRLAEIQALNNRAVNIRKMNVDMIRRNYGLGSLDTSAYEKQPPAIGATTTQQPSGGGKIKFLGFE